MSNSISEPGWLIEIPKNDIDQEASKYVTEILELIRAPTAGDVEADAAKE